MGVRSTLAGIVAAPARRVMEGEIRELIEQALAGRSFARAEDVAALRAHVDTGASDRIAALEARIAGLEKKLGMAMGAVQAVTADLVAVRERADTSAAEARQASQQATTARSTAEAAADGVSGVEAQLARLTENLGALATPRKGKASKAT